jgi:hypothetical protein
MRAFASCVAVILLDLLTWAVLWALAEPLGLRREAVTHALLAIRWHALATLLAAPPIWLFIDRTFGMLRIDESPAQKTHWGGS